MKGLLRFLLALLAATSLAAGAPTSAQDRPAWPGLPGAPGSSSSDRSEGFGDSRDKVAITIVPSAIKVAPGSDVVIAIIFDHHPGWHIHTNDPQVPKELGVPEDYKKTQIVAEVLAGSPLVPHTGFIQWPKPHKVRVEFGEAPVDYDVFEGKAIAYLPVTIPADARPGTAKLIIKPVFQACEKTCLRPTPEPPKPDDEPDDAWKAYGHEVTIEIVDPSTLAGASTHLDKTVFGEFDPSVWAAIHSGKSPPKIVSFDLFGLKFKLDAGTGLGLLLLLLVAALGGALLNFTPCVLPVIPIKIMSLSMSSGHRSRTLALGFWMFLGVVAFWMGLGAVIAGVSGFTSTNQLFQYPWFTISVGLIIAIMAIGMCGLFAVRLPQFVYAFNPGHDSYHGSFMFGIMTAILSTPCTAPFMGAAAAWAATQSPPIVLTVFFAIGFGMGLPYLVLSAFPKLVDRMPRTGPASELIKQLMGLLMLAAAAYFIGVGLSGMLVAPGDPPSRAYIWVVAMVVAAAGGWLAWRTFQITTAAGKRIVFGGLGVLLVAIAIVGGLKLTDKGPIDWVYYTPERLAKARQGGEVVVMEFTAEWCLNCKALEQTVLASDQVAALLAEEGVTPIKVDLTGRNAPGNEMLTRVDRRSIPLLVVFAPDGRETFKGDFYTIEQVVQAVREAQGRQVAVKSAP